MKTIADLLHAIVDAITTWKNEGDKEAAHAIVDDAFGTGTDETADDGDADTSTDTGTDAGAAATDPGASTEPPAPSPTAVFNDKGEHVGNIDGNGVFTPLG